MDQGYNTGNSVNNANTQNQTVMMNMVPADVQVINNRQDDDETTIDLGEIFAILLDKIWIILLVGALVGIFAFSISRFILVKKYTTSTQILVMNETPKNSTTGTSDSVSVSDLQSSTYLTKDYMIMVKSKPVMKAVIEELGLDLTYSQLADKISVSSPEETRILTITVEDTNPEMAKKIADSVREAAITHIQSIIGVDTVKAIDGEIGAVVPTSPSSPNWKRNTIIGFLMGVFIACLVVILSFVLDDTLRTQDDVENKIGVSVLVNFPYDENIDAGRYEKGTKEAESNKLKLRQNGQIITTSKEIRIKNTVSEAYKKLRSNIQFSGRDMRVIAISSTVPDEGKSTVSVNLAVSLAELGKKVIFIDADLRKNSIAKRYKVSRRVLGLTHYLSGVNSFDEIVCETNVRNMHMVFAGIIPPNPAELLESVYFRELVKQLRQTYDYVVIDTPPVGAVIDGAIIGKECDGVVMVIGSGDISYKLVERAKEQFETSGSHVIGAVLNKVPSGKSGRGYGGYYGRYYGKYYGQGYGYGSYYGEDEEKAEKDEK